MIEENSRKKRAGPAISKIQRQFIVESFTQDSVLTIISTFSSHTYVYRGFKS